MPAVFQSRLAALAHALDPFKGMSSPDSEPHAADAQQGRVFDLDALDAQIPPSTVRRVQKSLSTQSKGVPAQFDNAWHWASDWISKHGVTLPPDTSEYRSLRNWFCYQVNQFKKGELSKRSKELLAKYQIDLSQYRAPNTGTGQMLDDQTLILRLQMHYAITGSYDLTEDADAELLMWQRRLLDCYMHRGTSTRMRLIEAQLPGFRYGLWMLPNETPIHRTQMGWWHRAGEFRRAAEKFPAFRGKIDPDTPAYLGMWASDQIAAAREGKLTRRQGAELTSLGLLATRDHQRSQAREVVLTALRSRSTTDQPQATPFFGRRERDLKTFLGVSLLARLLKRNATLRDIYSTLSISPSQFARVKKSMELLMVQLMCLCKRNDLRDVRMLYRTYSNEFDQARNIDSLPDSVFSTLPGNRGQDIRKLASLLLEVRDLMRQIHVRQDIPDLEVDLNLEPETMH